MKKHTKRWFVGRVGKIVIRIKLHYGEEYWHTPTLIESKDHAEAMYIAQTTKNYRYDIQN